MSKNMTQKSLAIGAGFALVASSFAAAPAVADANGPLTLLPDGGAGESYTSLIGAGLNLTSTLNSNLQSQADPGTMLVLNADGVTQAEFNALTFGNDDSSEDATAIAAYNTASRIKDVSTGTFVNADGVNATLTNAVLNASTDAALAAALTNYENQTSADYTITTVTDVEFPELTDKDAWNNDTVNGSDPVVNSDGVTEAEYDAVVDADNDAALATAVAQYNASAGSTVLTIPRNDTIASFPTSFVYDSEEYFEDISFPTSWVAETVAYSNSPADAVDPLADVYYLIDNEDGAKLVLTLASSPVQQAVILYSSTGTATRHTSTTGTTVLNGSTQVTTDATLIAVAATSGAKAGDRSVAGLHIDAEDADSTSAISVDVTVFTDTVNSDADTELGKINNEEHHSATQTVTLLPASSVSVTTSMDATNTVRFNDAATPVAQANLAAEVTVGSNVNPYAVDEHLQVVFYEDGSVSGITTEYTTDAIGIADADDDHIADVAANSDGELVADATRDSNLISAVYTARTLFTGTTTDIFVGSRSAALDLRDGTNADVDGVKAVFSGSDDLRVESASDIDVEAREGTKSVTVIGQILEANDDLEDAGVRVRAVVTGTTVDEDSVITVTGSSTEIVEAGDAIVVQGFTDSNGQFPIVVNSTSGEDGDAVSVVFQVLDDSGDFIPSTAGSITWAAPVLQDDVDVSPSAFLTGDTIKVTFTAEDQFGVGMDETDNGRISIRVDAYIDGLVDTSEYSETEPTTNGSASFSFANFATAGSNQEIEVRVLEGSIPAGSPQYFTVYNNVDTSAIVVADEFETRVQYVDYVTGKTSDAAVNKAAIDAGVLALFTDADFSEAGTDYARIVGTVLDANNAGQPGQPVTISADGVLFHDGTTATIAEDTITTVANDQGFFDVQALTQTAVPAGATVSITAGGVTETTLLKSYLPADIEAKNLVFDWNVDDITFVKDTTYIVTLELKDVFGNPINTVKTNATSGITGNNINALTVDAVGSLQVNGIATVVGNFNSAGVATVFVRSGNDVAGPGQLSATVGNTSGDFNYFTGASSGELGLVDDASTPITSDVKSTSWDETLWDNSLGELIDVLETEPAGEQKVNAGSFKGYVAVYALGYEGQRLSAKIGNDWVIVDPIVNNESDNLFRVTDFTGAGVDIAVRIYIDRVLIDTIPLTTK